MNFCEEHLTGRPDRVRMVFEWAGTALGRRSGKEWRVTCPFHPDEHPSLDINLKKAAFLCRACGAGGDAVDFYARQTGMSAVEAIADLKRRLGLNGAGRRERRPARRTTFTIKGPNGNIVALHHRTDFEGGEKSFSWAEPDGTPGLGGVPVAELPLYGSEKVAAWHPDAPIVLTEGEKAADALTARGYSALATVTGAKGAPAARVVEVLRGRDVVPWPDNDEPGREHMDRIAKLLLPGIARSVRVLRWGEQPKDDAADFFARGGTEEQLDSRLAEAPAWAPSPPRPDVVEADPREREPVFRTLLDLERNPPPPVRFVVEPLFAEETLNLLFGKAFGGKSLFALQLGLHAAAGLEFLRTFRFPRPLRVLYLDEEMGVSLLSARIEKMKSARPEFRNPDVLGRFGFFSRAGLRLDDPKKLEFIRRKIGEFPGGTPDLGFMDTLRRMHRGEEKDSGEMAKLMETCSSLVEEFKTTLVQIHHSKKGPNDDEGDWREAARGSGDLIAASQTVLALWKSADLLFSLRADVKAAGEIQPLPLLLDSNTLLYSRQSEEERLEAKEKQHTDALNQAKAEIHKLLRKLKDRGGDDYPPSMNLIERRAGVNVKTAREAVHALVEDGELCKTRRKGRGGGYAYQYPEDAPGTSSEGGQE